MPRKNNNIASKLQGSLQEVQGPTTTTTSTSSSSSASSSSTFTAQRSFKVTKQVSSSSGSPGVHCQKYLEPLRTLSVTEFGFLTEVFKIGSEVGCSTLYQQSLHLKKVVQQVQAHFKQTDSASPSVVINIADCRLICNSFVDFFFESTGDAVPLLETLRNVISAFPSDAYQEQLQRHVSRFVDQLVESPQWIKIYILEALCEWPAAQPILSQYASQAVIFFTHLLNKYAVDFAEYQGLGNFNDTIKEAEQVIKIFLVFQTRLPEAFYLEMEQLLIQHLGGGLQNTRVALLTSSVSQLLANEYSSKECAFSAGMVFSNIIRNIISSFHAIKKLPYEKHQFIAEEMVRNVFSTFPIAVNRDGAPVLKLALPQFSSESAQFSAVPKILTYRGVMLTLESDLLISPIWIQVNGERKLGTILTEALLQSFLSFCEVSVTRYTRMLALQVLHECLNKIAAIVKDQAGSKNNQLELTLCNVRFFEDLLEYVWKNWDDLFEPIIDQTKNIFKTALDLYDVSCAVYSNNQQLKEFSVQFIPNLMSRLVAVDWHKKSKYSMMTMLCSRFSISLLLSQYSDMLSNLFTAMSDQGICHTAAQFFETLLTLLKKESSSEATVVQLWSQPMVDSLFSSNANSVSINKGVITYALPSALKLYPSCLLTLLEIVSKRENIPGPSMMRVILSMLKSGRKLRLIQADTLESFFKGSKLSSASLIRNGLLHDDEAICLDALELVCQSSKESEEPSSFECEMIKLFLNNNLKSARTNFRQVSMIKLSKFLQRLKESAVRKFKAAKKLSTQERENAIRDPVNMVNWMIEIISASLYPGAPFAREHLCLQLLKAILDVWGSDQHPEIALVDKVNLFSEQNTLALLQALQSRFDNTRQLAYDMLMRFPSPLPGFQTAESTIPLFNHATKLVHSPRNRECESGSLLFTLLFKKYIITFNWVPTLSKSDTILRTSPSAVIDFVYQISQLLAQHLAVASKDLEIAARDAPMHGPVLALRTLVSVLQFSQFSVEESHKWKDLQQQLLDQTREVIHIAMRVVADLAPEGYSSGSHDCSDNLVYQGHNGQLLTTCSWLSVKEVALFLGTLVTVVPLPDTKGERLLTCNQIKAIGELFLHILISTRHVGAIEKSYLSFQVLCQQLLQSKVPELFELPAKWMEVLLDSIQHTQQVTRRSAGLPFGFRAILRAEALQIRPFKITLIPKLMRSLLLIASTKPEPTTVKYQSQVHAINILRSIFADADLFAEVEEYIVDAFTLAIECYRSPNWSVRNSATMIFSTLTTKSIGHQRVQEEVFGKSSETTFKEFFGKFPPLHPFLLSQLATSVDHEAVIDSEDNAILESSTYAILVLLSRLAPSPLDNTNNALSPSSFIPFVRGCCYRPNYMIRQMASLALVPLISSVNLPSFLSDLIHSLPDQPRVKKNNVIHGTLLQVYQLLKGHSSRSIISSTLLHELHANVLPLLNSKVWLLTPDNPCKATSSLLFQLIFEFLPRSSPVRTAAAALATQALNSEDTMLPLPMISYSLLEAAKLALSNEIYRGNSQNISSLLGCLLNHASYEVRFVTLKSVTKIFQTEDEKSIRNVILDLQSKLLQRLFEEQNEGCLKKIVQILFDMNLPILQDTLTSKSYIQLWNRLHTLVDSSVRVKVIPFMGFVLQQAYKCTADVKSSDLQTLCSTWVKLVSFFSTSDQIVDYRRAVCKAVISCLDLYCVTFSDLTLRSNIVGHLPSVVLDSVIQSWITVAKLLQDEEDDIRSDVAAFITRKLPPHESYTMALISYKPAHAHSLVLNFLTETFPSSEVLFNYLVNEIDTDDNIEFNLEYSSVLFEKEEDNNFEEQIMILQLSSYYLKKLLKYRLQQADTDLRDWIANKRNFLAHQLQRGYSLLQDQITTKSQRSELYKRFTTYEPDIFMPLYQLALGIAAYRDTQPTDMQASIDQILSLPNLHPMLHSTLQYLKELRTQPFELCRAKLYPFLKLVD